MNHFLCAFFFLAISTESAFSSFIQDQYAACLNTPRLSKGASQIVSDVLAPYIGQNAQVKNQNHTIQKDIRDFKGTIHQLRDKLSIQENSDLTIHLIEDEYTLLEERPVLRLLLEKSFMLLSNNAENLNKLETLSKNGDLDQESLARTLFNEKLKTLVQVYFCGDVDESLAKEEFLIEEFQPYVQILNAFSDLTQLQIITSLFTTNQPALMAREVSAFLDIHFSSFNSKKPRHVTLVKNWSLGDDVPLFDNIKKIQSYIQRRLIPASYTDDQKEQLSALYANCDEGTLTMLEGIIEQDNIFKIHKPNEAIKMITIEIDRIQSIADGLYYDYYDDDQGHGDEKKVRK